MVAQEMVEPGQGLRNVAFAERENERKSFAGMEVIEIEAPRLRQGRQGGSGQGHDRPGGGQPRHVAEKAPS